MLEIEPVFSHVSANARELKPKKAQPKYIMHTNRPLNDSKSSQSINMVPKIATKTSCSGARIKRVHFVQPNLGDLGIQTRVGRREDAILDSQRCRAQGPPPLP